MSKMKNKVRTQFHRFLDAMLIPYNVVFGPIKRFRNSIAFAVLFNAIGTSEPSRRWLSVVTFVSLWVAEKCKWALTGYSLYKFTVYGLHGPFWLTVVTTMTSFFVVVVFALAKMELQHHGYLAS